MSDRPLLLVDLDGTITDSLPGIAASLHYALEAVGTEWDENRDIRLIAGPPMPETLASLGLAGDDLTRALAAYRERYAETGWLENSVFDGMSELLTGLAGGGYRMAVATSKDEKAARRILEHFELAPCFEFIGGADLSVGRSAKADVIAHSLDALGAPAVRSDTEGALMIGDRAHDVEGALMIGDRAHDVEGAAVYGIPTAIVRWGYGSELEWDSARWSVGSATELERIIHER